MRFDWSQWAKPVLFEQNDLLMEHRQPATEWPQLDLPRATSVDYGIAAARLLEWHLGDTEARQIDVPKPSYFRSIFQRALATMGLRRNKAGGFGGIIPQPSSGG